MKVQQHFPLKKFNTFGIEAKAEFYAAVKSVEELKQALALGIQPIHLLGGGSNILLTGDVAGLLIKNEIGGMAVVEEGADIAIVAAGGGVVWHQLVLWCIEKNLGGIENLSLIPGSVGAAPIQNIGAYGVELKDVFDGLEAVPLDSEATPKSPRHFTAEDCQFGYRDSIFKNELKGKYCITKVFLKLSKTPGLNTSYGDIQKVLAEKNITAPTIRNVSEAVIAIRRSKLPDPAELGNAGSFFKNPEVEALDFQQLVTAFPQIPHYDLPSGKVKIPAGWLIEQAGWKGRREGQAGCHARQALVLVNYGGASGREIFELALRIQASVEEQFGVRIMPEVNVW